MHTSAWSMLCLSTTCSCRPVTVLLLPCCCNSWSKTSQPSPTHPPVQVVPE
jgi:hypothetical protein